MKIFSHKQNWLRFIPLLILLIGLAAFFYFDLNQYLTLASLKEYQNSLVNLTNQNFFLASLIFVISYIILTAISAPGAVFLTLTGGFLFGVIFGTIYVVIGATLGATLIFLAAKTALKDLLYKKSGAKLQNFKQGLEKNAVSYLLFLRLVPLFPFWLVNIAPAFFKIKTRIFFLTTLVGIIPGTIVYVWLGSGLGKILAGSETLNLGIIFKPEILIPIILLGCLALAPVIYKKIQARKS